ncbi:hypothetical protein SAMN03159353_101815 [Cedecea sp. NFIX57]|nr:hypothetical protein SAMN03159353_101815 [Cedecea sp. NFIX57]
MVSRVPMLTLTRRGISLMKNIVHEVLEILHEVEDIIH